MKEKKLIQELSENLTKLGDKSDRQLKILSDTNKELALITKILELQNSVSEIVDEEDDDEHYTTVPLSYIENLIRDNALLESDLVFLRNREDKMREELKELKTLLSSNEIEATQGKKTDERYVNETKRVRTNGVDYTEQSVKDLETGSVSKIMFGYLGSHDENGKRKWEIKTKVCKQEEEENES